MATKKITGNIKLQILAGKANPSPPVGPALGQHGVNIMDFCKKFNAQTQGQGDLLIPVLITVYQDRSFSFVTKTPPVSVLIKKELKLKSGSKMPQKDKVGKINSATLKKIAEIKLSDLNGFSLESAISQVTGTAKSMGIEIMKD